MNPSDFKFREGEDAMSFNRRMVEGGLYDSVMPGLSKRVARPRRRVSAYDTTNSAERQIGPDNKEPLRDGSPKEAEGGGHCKGMCGAELRVPAPPGGLDGG